MRKVLAGASFSGGWVFFTFEVSDVTFLTPIPHWLTSIVLGLVIPILLSSPEIVRFLGARVIAKWRHKPPKFNALLASDGSITLQQAAFLWLGAPTKQPVPLDVQDRLQVFKNAIEQGALSRYDRGSTRAWDPEFLRIAYGEPILDNDCVLVTELRRWAETVGYIPEFLRWVKPSSKPQVNQ